MLITRRVINMEGVRVSVWSTQAPRRGRPHFCGVGGCVVHTTPARGSPRALKRGLATPQCGVTAKTTRKPPPGRIYGRSPSWPGGNAKRCLHTRASNAKRCHAGTRKRARVRPDGCTMQNRF